VQLADYNPTAAPVLDAHYLECLKIAVSQLFPGIPGSAFREEPGLKLPPQDSFNDCFFHTALFQANVINPCRGEDGQTNLRPHRNDWKRDAARLRSYVLFIFYCQMHDRGADLPELKTAYLTWTQQQQPPACSSRKRRGFPTPDSNSDSHSESARRSRLRGGPALRSEDMNRCRLAVVHTRYWEAYINLEKGVEFRSPRQPIHFFPGMILLLALNANERRKGRTELLMAVVLGISVLRCSEAFARFPVEARACKLSHAMVSNRLI
jgi:hypothetical protein